MLRVQQLWNCALPTQHFQSWQYEIWDLKNWIFNEHLLLIMWHLSNRIFPRIVNCYYHSSTFTRKHTHTHAHTLTPKHIHSHTHTRYTHPYTHSHTHIHTLTRTHTNIHTQRAVRNNVCYFCLKCPNANFAYLRFQELIDKFVCYENTFSFLFCILKESIS